MYDYDFINFMDVWHYCTQSPFQLMRAVGNQNVEAVKTLIDKGADLNASPFMVRNYM